MSVSTRIGIASGATIRHQRNTRLGSLTQAAPIYKPPCSWCSGVILVEQPDGTLLYCPMCNGSGVQKDPPTHTHHCENCNIIFDCLGDRCADMECQVCTGELAKAGEVA
jgi:hypothetical protein